MFLHKGYTARATQISETEKHGGIRGSLPARSPSLPPTGKACSRGNGPATTSGRSLVLVAGPWQAALANWPNVRAAQRAGNNEATGHHLLPARRLAGKFPQDSCISPFGPVRTLATANTCDSSLKDSARPHNVRQKNAAGAQGPSPRAVWRCLCRCWPRQPSPQPRAWLPRHRSSSSRRCRWCRSRWSSGAAACAPRSTAQARPE